jgi:hypothetical protein
MLKLLLGVCLISVAFSGSLHAATKSEEDACERDVMRLCHKLVNQGDLAILGCLKERRARISRACDKVLKDHGQ